MSEIARSEQEITAAKLAGENNPAAEPVKLTERSNTDAVERIAGMVKAGASFSFHGMTGHPTEGWPLRGVPHPVHPDGRNAEHLAGLADATYVVMSGSDPIAWRGLHGWTIPGDAPFPSKKAAQHANLMLEVARIMES